MYWKREEREGREDGEDEFIAGPHLALNVLATSVQLLRPSRQSARDENSCAMRASQCISVGVKSVMVSCQGEKVERVWWKGGVILVGRGRHFIADGPQKGRATSDRTLNQQ